MELKLVGSEIGHCQLYDLAISTSLQHANPSQLRPTADMVILHCYCTPLDRLSRPFSAPTAWQTRGTVAAFESN
jgi:hypothetical protein